MTRRFAAFAGYALIFAALPTLCTIALASMRMSSTDSLGRDATATREPTTTNLDYDPDKPVAVLLVSNELTEVTDLFAPYAILAASGAFNVYTVAPLRQISDVWTGVAIAPDLSFDELAARFPDGPDLIVLPYFGDYDNPVLVDWLRRQGAGRRVLSVCEGARTVAAAGLLRGRTATSHFYALPQLRREYPQTEWVGDVRAVADDGVISSGGVTAAIDATLLAVRTLAGPEAATRAGHAIGLPRGFGDERVEVITAMDVTLLALQAAYSWPATRIGVLLAPGVDEIGLAALLDTHPRTFAARVTTLAPDDQPIVSRHGMRLVARSTLATAPRLDRLFAASAEADTPASRRWADARGLRIERAAEGSVERAYGTQIADVAAQRGDASGRLVAKLIEFPVGDIDAGAATAYAGRIAKLAVQPLALGAVGVVLTRLGVRRWRKK